MSQCNLCHSAVHATVQFMSQRNSCHSAIYITAQLMSQHNLCHSTTYITAQLMLQHNLCHSTIYVTAQLMSQHNLYHSVTYAHNESTFLLKSRLWLIKLLLRSLLSINEIVESKKDTLIYTRMLFYKRVKVLSR